MRRCQATDVWQSKERSPSGKIDRRDLSDGEHHRDCVRAKIGRRYGCGKAKSQQVELEEHPLQAVDAADSETEPDRIGLAAESDLLHIALNVPFNVRTAAEKDHVTDVIALRRHAFAFEDDRSFEDDDGRRNRSTN